jgi:hypothetical protein
VIQAQKEEKLNLIVSMAAYDRDRTNMVWSWANPQGAVLTVGLSAASGKHVNETSGFCGTSGRQFRF